MNGLEKILIWFKEGDGEKFEKFMKNEQKKIKKSLTNKTKWIIYMCKFLYQETAH